MSLDLALRAAQWGLSLAGFGSKSSNLTGELLDQVLQIRAQLIDLHESISDLSDDLQSIGNSIINAMIDGDAEERKVLAGASVDGVTELVSQIVNLRQTFVDGAYTEKQYNDLVKAKYETMRDRFETLLDRRRAICRSVLAREDLESLLFLWWIELNTRMLLAENGYPDVYSAFIHSQMKDAYIAALDKTLLGEEQGSLGHRLNEATTGQQKAVRVLAKYKLQHGSSRCGFVYSGMKDEDGLYLLESRIYAQWQLTFKVSVTAEELRAAYEDTREVFEGIKFKRIKSNGAAFLQFSASRKETLELYFGRMPDYPDYGQMPEGCERLHRRPPRQSENFVVVDGWKRIDRYPTGNVLERFKKRYQKNRLNEIKKTGWYLGVEKDYINLNKKISELNLWTIRREISNISVNMAQKLRNEIHASAHELR